MTNGRELFAHTPRAPLPQRHTGGRRNTSAFAPKYTGENGDRFTYGEETEKRFGEGLKLDFAWFKARKAELNTRFRLQVLFWAEKQVLILT